MVIGILNISKLGETVTLIHTKQFAARLETPSTHSAVQI